MTKFRLRVQTFVQCQNESADFDTYLQSQIDHLTEKSQTTIGLSQTASSTGRITTTLTWTEPIVKDKPAD